MKPATLKYCPRCGSIGYQYRERKFWYCPVCLFTYFHNVATSASVIVEAEGGVLMLVRNHEPQMGMLALPGGFVDPDERAEDAAIRECREETSLKVGDLRFLGSWPNEYEYKNVTYKTCDFYFRARFDGSLNDIRPDYSEVAAFHVIMADEIETAPIAFESAREALRAWKAARERESNSGTWLPFGP